MTRPGDLVPRVLRVAALVLTTLLASAQVSRAGVSVARDEAGHFKSLEVTQSEHRGLLSHWFAHGHSPDQLNPRGDRNGDLAPRAVVLEAGILQDDPSPVVIWSRNDGEALHVVWSRWTTDDGWTTPQAIGLPGSSTDEIAPFLLVDSRQALHVAWYTRTPVPSVWYAELAHGSWSEPKVLSPSDLDSRNPTLVLAASGSLYVNYEDWTTTPVVVRSSFIKETFDP